jgi:AraC-like DNA-binding protein
MDTLSKVLNTLEFDSNFYFSVRFNGQWGVTVPDYARVARFHICCKGRSLFKIKGVSELVALNQGDIIIIPHGVAHTLMSTLGVETESLDDAFTTANYDGSKFFEYGDGVGSEYSELLCGHFEFQHILPHPFIDQLPSYILLKKGDSNEFGWLENALSRYTQEDQINVAGNSLIIKHLSEITFTLAVQYWQKTQDKRDGFIAAIADPGLSKALSAFHDDPALIWRIEDLANVAAMSRTRFIAHFTNTVKMPPSQYVTLWRMTSAQKMLRTTSHSLQKIANSCGYESVTAFSKAFKRFTAQSPGEFRKVYTDVEPGFERKV